MGGLHDRAAEGKGDSDEICERMAGDQMNENTGELRGTGVAGEPSASADGATQTATEPVTQAATDGPDVDIQLRAILCEVLGLDTGAVAMFDTHTGLFGHLPELDSMAVAGLLTEMEDRLGIIIEDDDVDAEMLETYGGLLAFAEAKTGA